MHTDTFNRAGWQAEVTMGDRLRVLCGSRNRLTGLGLSGVCVPPADGLSDCLHFYITYIKKVRIKCMHVCMHARTHVRDAGMWIEKSVRAHTADRQGCPFV